VPGLVRLLRAYFAKQRGFAGALQGSMQAIFQRFHFMLDHRKLRHCAFALLSAIFRYLPFELYQPYFQPALSLASSRLQARKAPDLEKEFVVALSIFVYVHEDPATLPAAFEQTQPGMFANFVTEVWLPGAKRVVLLQRRKICVFGLVKLMGYREVRESKELLGACCEGLASLVKWKSTGLMAWLAAFLPPLRNGGADEESADGQEFEVPFSRLRHAEVGPAGGLWDPLPEIQDVSAGLEAVRAALAPLQPALLELGQAAQTLIEALRPNP